MDRFVIRYQLSSPYLPCGQYIHSNLYIPVKNNEKCSWSDLCRTVSIFACCSIAASRILELLTSSRCSKTRPRSIWTSKP
uniref:Uncharacterized protein n=1 Tax=Kalanchoe fedtschenkoi TaxID=63787 RepID=A0A7N0VER8_KALFE